MAKYFLTGGLDGPWKKSKVDNLSTKPIECTATLVKDAETQKGTITLNKTAADIWEAAEAGKQVKATIENVPVGEDATATVTVIVPIEIFQIALEGGTFYTIKARIDLTESDALYMNGDLAASDTVVLMEV